jgi:hypothetical protein
MNLYGKSIMKFHAVHHFAIIAMILRIQGFEPPADFGFAASIYIAVLKAIITRILT